MASVFDRGKLDIRGMSARKFVWLPRRAIVEIDLRVAEADGPY
jgi:hypothetical protein